MTLADLLCSLRQRLLDARTRSDQKALRELEVTFDLLTESAYELKDRAVASILEDMESSTRDFLTGVGWKGNVPSAEAIRAALSPPQNT